MDLIDRQAVRFIESESKYDSDWNHDYEDRFSDALEKVLALPSVQLERKTGYWIVTYDPYARLEV